ncbi:SCF ubiquitin ligase complex subunit cdc4 [Glugoides intestinalis]
MEKQKSLKCAIEQHKCVKKNDSNQICAPPEVLSRVISYCETRNLQKIISFSSVLDLIYSNPEILNYYCRTSGNSLEECIQILRDKHMLLQSIQKGLEQVVTFNTKQKDMTQLSVFGNLIFVSSDDQSIKAFDFDGVRIKKFIGHSGGVWTFDCDDSRLVTGSTDKTAKIWCLETGQSFITLKYHRSTIRILKMHGEYIVTGSRDCTIAVWNLFGDLLHRLDGHNQSIRCMDLNDEYLVSGSYDGYCKLWDYRRGKLIKDIHKHHDRIYCVKMSNGYIASAGYNSEVKVSSIDGKVSQSYKLHNSVIGWLDIKDGFVVSSSLDGIVVKFNYISGIVDYVIKTGCPIKGQKLTETMIIIATLNNVMIFSLKNGKFIRTLMKATMICKVEVVDWKILVGYQQDGVFKVSIFNYENCKKKYA